ATTASFRSVEKRRLRATPVITSTLENVSDIGTCLGLSLGPPASAGVRSKRGALHVRGHAFRLGSGIGHGFSTPGRARWVANTVSGNAMAVLPRIRSSRRLIQLPRCRGRLVRPNYPLPV